jgi:hypothetical protein
MLDGEKVALQLLSAHRHCHSNRYPSDPDRSSCRREHRKQDDDRHGEHEYDHNDFDHLHTIGFSHALAKYIHTDGDQDNHGVNVNLLYLPVTCTSS